MKLTIFVIAAAMLGIAADLPSTQPTTVSAELRAKYWRSAAEVQSLDAQDKAAHDALSGAVAEMRAECGKQSRDLSQDAKGEPVCVARAEKTTTKPANNK